MQTQRRSAKVLDRIAGTGVLFVSSFLFFLLRLSHLLQALVLAIGFTVLLLYGLRLLRQRTRSRHNEKELSKRQTEAMREAYAMLPLDQALSLACQQLCKRYALHPLHRSSTVAFAMNADKKKIAVTLAQSPAPVSVDTVYLFHKRRAALPAALLSVGEPTQEAVAYAKRLTPPMRLLCVTALPFDETVAEQFDKTEGSPVGSALRSMLERITCPAQARRYMGLAAFLVGGYILTDSIFALIPCMFCTLLALIARHRQPACLSLFQDDL